MRAEIIQGTLTSFTGALLALFLASIVWLAKLAYEKHRAEMLALAKFERIFANNLTILKDNFEFMDEWINVLKVNRCYSFHFESYFINEKETYKISDVRLINKILSTNYKLRRTGLDLENLYKSYWEIILKIDSLQDEDKKRKDLKEYNERVTETLQQMKNNKDILQEDIVETIATIRSVHQVRFHSVSNYINLLFTDIFPRVTEKSIADNKKKIGIEISENALR